MVHCPAPRSLNVRYDRWNCMPEKRAAMAKWHRYVRGLLSRKKLKQAD